MKKSWLVTSKRNVPSLDPKVFVSPPSPLVSNASSINATPTSMLSFFQIYCWCRTWYASHCIGSVILALPILAVFTNFNCQVTHHHYVENQRDLFIQLVFVSLAHFCNLSALNYCFKSLLATISASGTSSSHSVEKSAFFCQSDFT